MKKQEFLTALWKQLSDLPNDDVERSLDYYSEMIDDRMEAGMSEEDAVAEIGSVEDVAKQIAADAPKGKTEKAAASSGDTQQAAAAGYRAGTADYYSTEGQTTADYNGPASGASGRTSPGTFAGRNHGAVYNEAYAEALDEYVNGPQTRRRKSSGGMSGGKVALLICLFPLWFPLLITLGSLIFAAFVTIWALTFSYFVVAGSFVFAGLASAIALFFFVISGNVAAGFVNLGAGLVLLGLGILMFLAAGAVVRGVSAVTRGMWGGFARIFRRREAAV